MKKDNILKPASFLFAITGVVAVINFVYNIIMSRMLSVPDFGDLRALFSILMIISVPVTALQTMIAKFTAEYSRTNLGKLKSITMHMITIVLFFGLAFIITFVALRYPIYKYLKISSANLVILLGPLMLLALIQPIIWGIYQGLKRFVILGANILTATILKLLLGVVFVYFGFKTQGAMYGLLSSGILTILLFGLLLISLLRRDNGPAESFARQDVYSYSGYALGVLICYSVLSQIDLIIVKNKFLPAEAGLYACAAVIGKSFLFLPVPVVTVLFPKVVENNKRGISSLPILLQSLFVSLILCMMGVGICLFFPHYLIKMFGEKYTQALYLFKIFGLAMTPLALFYVLMNYFLSEYRLKFFYYCLLICILGTVILFILPRTLSQFLLVLGWYGLLIFILPLVYILSEARTYGAKRT